MHIDLLSALAYRHGPEAAHRIPRRHLPCHEPGLASQPILSTDGDRGTLVQDLSGGVKSLVGEAPCHARDISPTSARATPQQGRSLGLTGRLPKIRKEPPSGDPWGCRMAGSLLQVVAGWNRGRYTS